METKLPPDGRKLLARSRCITTMGTLKALKGEGVLRALSLQKVGSDFCLRDVNNRVAYTTRRLTPRAMLEMLSVNGYKPLREEDFDARGYVAPHPAVIELVLRSQHRLYRGEVPAFAKSPPAGIRLNFWRHGRLADMSHIGEVAQADFDILFVDRLEITTLGGPVVFTQKLDDLEEATFWQGPVRLVPGCQPCVHQTFASSISHLRYLSPGADPARCEDLCHDIGLCGCFLLGPGLPVMPMPGLDVNKSVGLRVKRSSAPSSPSDPTETGEAQ